MISVLINNQIILNTQRTKLWLKSIYLSEWWNLVDTLLLRGSISKDV